MIHLYESYIRPKLTYGITAVASASKTNLYRLERIQNAAIRVAVGARSTSPIQALQVEANIPPLIEQIKGACCKTYFRMSSHSHPIIQQMKEDDNVEDRVWTKVFKPPFIKRCRTTLTSWGLQNEIEVKRVLLPSRPPWNKPKIKLEWDMNSIIQKNQSKEETKAVALDTINTRYRDHLKIYTDGSKIGESTSAAIWIPDMEVEDSWRLDHGQYRSIMGAELYAISRALHWLILNQPLMTNMQVVVLSDSRSGIMAIDNYRAKSYSHMTNQILNLANILDESEVDVTIQWIPSHVGLSGNEQADSLAKAAHAHVEETATPLDQNEIKKLLETKLRSRCQTQYAAVSQDLHIGRIKQAYEQWPWTSFKSRRTETAMARLRIGHTKLKQNLFRFNLADEANCSVCRVPETPEHVMVSCQRFTAHRNIMHQTLRKLGIQMPDLRVLLGGGRYETKIQEEIKTAVERFLTSSGAIDLI